ncbi:PAS domain-containing sensor histidine kinase [Candidatus Hydrogenosomobacter endosymbioticus]|uniref:histidine kinase n=1 Tax=Candidatus Hydrogenosomobacter endosymbioticus TaxID=2558174 RepID=A0ABN6L411_9PROT|nr:PAS domain-containing sensor histidine kinase [Candidatus Hydrogenosomobacter endosymbioticus]BDB96504.1 hybrid sensor histidine kinase/response regulator [Candidatus Hydrogenosomobacter endosymbioticus]
MREIADIAKTTDRDFFTSPNDINRVQIIELDYAGTSQKFVVRKISLSKNLVLWQFEENRAQSILSEFASTLLSHPLPVCIASDEGKILFVNSVFTEWLGYSVQYLYGSDFLDLFETPPSSWEDFHTKVFLVKDANGALIPTAISNVISLPSVDIVGLFLAPMEATSRIKSVNDPALLELIPIAAAFLDERGGIKAVNGLLRNKLPFYSGTYTALGQWIAEKDKSALAKSLKTIRKSRSMQDPVSLRLKGRENKTITAFLKYILPNDERSPGQFLAVFDEPAEDRLPAKDTNPQRLQILGQLSGGIVHDFNNLLTGIMGFCDLLLQRHTDGDSSKDIMQIKQSSMRAAKLIQQLLAFSKSTTPVCSPLDIPSCIQDLAPLIRKMIGPKIMFTIQQQHSIRQTYGDRGQLEQVLLNLAINARDAMPNGGSLIFSIKSELISAPIPVAKGSLSAQKYIVVDVIDTGTGIPKEHLSHIFDPFFSTKDPGQGTGLGLANVIQIMESFKGGVNVQTALKSGTTFSLYFPEYADAPTEGSVTYAANTTAAPQKIRSSSAKILLVEDEDAVRLFASRALKEKGYDVVEARDGQHAVSIVKQHPDVSIVVTDVMMPGVDGPSLAEIVRKNNSEIKILFVSGYPEDEVRAHLSNTTSDVYFLQKPFALTELVNEVQKLSSIDDTKKIVAEIKSTTQKTIANSNV